jgi:hypothetical protein
MLFGARFKAIHLMKHSGYTISWKHISDGRYSAASAYLIHFEAPTNTFIKASVWDNWAHLSAISSLG